MIPGKKRKKILDFLPSAVVALCSVILFAFPAYTAAGARQGVDLCLKVVVPSLFPFFVLSNLIRNGKIADALGKLFGPVMKLFSLPEACGGIFVLGLLSGFPVGAEGSVSLYNSGQCTKKQGERLLALADNPSPAFVISAVGAGLFGSAAAGWTMFLCQTAAVFAAGMLTARFSREKEPVFLSRPKDPEKPFPVVFTEGVTDALFSVLKVCAFVIFFIMLTDLPVQAGIFEKNSVENLFFSGFLELTSGCGALANLPLPKALPLAGVFLGWAGVSVLCQVAVFAFRGGLSLRPYLLTRVLQSILCGGLTFLCTLLFFS